MAELTIHTERIDDIPLLLEQQVKMGIPQVIDAVISPHGNRQGLSVGELTTSWISYILSEADHRMVFVEPWAEQHIETFKGMLGKSVGVKDFTDDRLADVLCFFSDDDVWEEVETQLGQRLIRVYHLNDEPIRLDSTTAATYHDTEGNLLFRHGHSKDHRPDLPQLKVMLGTLDPMGLPIATLVVPGNEADDGLYVPAVQRAQKVVGCGGRLYVGDSKMSALDTRAKVQTSGDYYLLPLPQKGRVPELLSTLLEPVFSGQQRLKKLYPPADSVIKIAGTTTPQALLAVGYQVIHSRTAQVDGQQVVWPERVLVVYSPSLAKQTRRGLALRLERAEQALLALTPEPGRGKRQWEDQQSLQTAAQRIIKKHRVFGLLSVRYQKEVEQKSIRKYKSRKARTEKRVRYVVKVQRNEDAITFARRPLGWRLYVTNAPLGALSLESAVWVYRGAPRIERNFTRLKGHPLGLRPMYVQREDHALGLVRLLSLALRVLTLVEHVVREGLAAADESLNGLYAGNPKRQTARPTTERLLGAFEGITLTMVAIDYRVIRHMTPLSPLQQRILALLGLDESIYSQLGFTADPIPP